MGEFDDKPTIKTGRYQHYKGGLYTVLGIGCHTERHEYYVVYTPTNQKPDLPDFWIRPYDMFAEMINVDGKTIPRFAKLDD